MLLECVPNFSEGCDQQKLNQIATSIRSVPGISFLGMDSSRAANRTVMTFAGPPESVLEAAFRAIRTAAETIDMRQQKGVHPRIGATDVCPLIPLRGLTTQDAVLYARELAQRVGKELGIPVYLYAHSAEDLHRIRLSDIRRGGYEALAERMQLAEHFPDFGPRSFQPKVGATVIGARDLMIAYNMNLENGSLALAKKIAAHIREQQKPCSDRKKSQGFKGLRAIGWYLEAQNLTQVSTNIMDLSATAIHEVFERVQFLAGIAGARVSGSEIIGLIPRQPLQDAGSFFLDKWNQSKLDPVEAAIEGLALNSNKPFNPATHVLENALHLGQNLPITASSRSQFQS